MSYPAARRCREARQTLPTGAGRLGKTGDDGSAGMLFGGRVSKADSLVEVLGAIDEAVAALGPVRAFIDGGRLPPLIFGLQRGLFVAGAELVVNPRSRERLVLEIFLVTAEMTGKLEQEIDRLVNEEPLGNALVVPGTNRVSAAPNLGRTILRRAEPRLVGLIESGSDVTPEVLVYINRASDLISVLACRTAGRDEPLSHD